MGVNQVIYNGTTLIDLTGDTVTADTLAEGVVAHDKRGERIVGTMVAGSGGGTGENHITEVGVMIDGEPVTIRDDGSRLTTVINEDESIVETRTFLDGTTEVKTTVFNSDDTVTETTVANGETTTKLTTFTDLGMITMNTTNGNQLRRGESKPDNNFGIDGDVFLLSEEIQTVTPLNYIESTGAQYIDTGFKPNNNTRVVMDVQCVGLSNMSETYALFGVGSGSTRFEMHKASSSNWNLTWFYGSVYSNRFPITTDVYNSRFIIDYNKNTATVDGTSMTYTAQTFSVNDTLHLFATKRDGSVMSITPMRMYPSQIYDNDVLVRDYIPVIDANGEACLYDKLNHVYYHNKGTGAFTAGSAIGGVEGLPTEIKEIAMYMKINGAWTLLAEVA